MIAKGGPASGTDRISGIGLRARPGDATDGANLGQAAILEGTVSTGDLEVFGDLTVHSFNDLEVFGNLTVHDGTKNFKIDHPLDPENKYLVHAAIESSEVLNVYSGNVTTNEQGEAIITLPEWFDALNSSLGAQASCLPP